MVESFEEREKRITKGYIERELLANYIEEFGLSKPTKKKVKFIVEQGI